MEKEKKKIPVRNVVFYASIVVIMMCFATRFSYAYFTATVTNATPPTATTVQTGTLSVKFEDGAKYINAQDMVLTTAEEAATATDNYSSFTITNNGNVNAKYKLYLANYNITENLVSDDFKWKLTIGDETKTGTFKDLFKDGVYQSNTVDIPIDSTTRTLAPNEKINCEFRVWLQETQANQIGLTNGSFSTTIRVIATS